MEIAVVLIMLALIQYILFCQAVGYARGKYGVEAPACTGNENFERLYRIQMNTLEQLVIFIPAMLAFSYYVSARWALVPGLCYLIGRIVYYFQYSQGKNRFIGFAMTMLSNIALVLGSLIAAAMKVNL